MSRLVTLLVSVLIPLCTCYATHASDGAEKRASGSQWPQTTQEGDLPPEVTTPMPTVDEEFTKRLAQMSQSEAVEAILQLTRSQRDWTRACELRARAVMKRRLEHYKKLRELREKEHAARNEAAKQRSGYQWII